MKYYVTGAVLSIFAGKTGLIVSMLVTTLAILAFVLMALRLRSGVVGSLNEVLTNVMERFVLPKDVTDISNNVSSVTNGGTFNGDSSNNNNNNDFTNVGGNTSNNMAKNGVAGAAAGRGRDGDLPAFEVAVRCALRQMAGKL